MTSLRVCKSRNDANKNRVTTLLGFFMCFIYLCFMSDVNANCACCSGKIYSECCQPFHEGIPATTAEKLMRSRYCAYALCLPQYLMDTTYPAKRKGLTIKEIEDWSTENKWQQLEIVKSNASVVEFKAYYSDGNGQNFVHHERSTFTLDKGKWYYVKGQFFN